jgi:hypothetical protein
MACRQGYNCEATLQWLSKSFGKQDLEQEEAHDFEASSALVFWSLDYLGQEGACYIEEVFKLLQLHDSLDEMGPAILATSQLMGKCLDLDVVCLLRS